MGLIDWKVRFTNPLFWVGVIASIVMPLIVGVGLEWSDMTTWDTLGNTIVTALGNPVVVVTMLVSVYNAVVNYTTPGVADHGFVEIDDFIEGAPEDFEVEHEHTEN